MWIAARSGLRPGFLPVEVFISQKKIRIIARREGGCLFQ
jgi:hypothetical protein